MRWLEPEVTEPAEFEPVDLTAAKAAQRIDGTDEDANLQGYLLAARGVVEDRTGQKLATQTVVLRAWGFDCSLFLLPLAPVQSITSITYLDNNGATQTLSTDVYGAALYGLKPMVYLKHNQSWPAHRCEPGSVAISCVAGYAADAAPDPIKQAIKLAFGNFNRNREESESGIISEVAAVAIDALLANHRRSYL